jgi:thioredoxin-related protein
MKKIFWILTLGFFFSMQGLSAQEKINWLSLEDAYKLQQTKPKKIIIDVYTGWCGWCKVMDKNTFSNATVAKYINANYYAVKLDAESTKDIKIGTTVYKYDAQSRANQAAVALLQGQMSYPSIVYLDEKFNMIQPMPGYLNAKEFHEVITFFGGNYHKKQNFDHYKATTYKSSFKNVKI